MDAGWEFLVVRYVLLLSPIFLCLPGHAILHTGFPSRTVLACGDIRGPSESRTAGPGTAHWLTGMSRRRYQWQRPRLGIREAEPAVPRSDGRVWAGCHRDGRQGANVRGREGDGYGERAVADYQGGYDGADEEEAGLKGEGAGSVVWMRNSVIRTWCKIVVPRRVLCDFKLYALPSPGQIVFSRSSSFLKMVVRWNLRQKRCEENSEATEPSSIDKQSKQKNKTSPPSRP